MSIFDVGEVSHTRKRSEQTFTGVVLVSFSVGIPGNPESYQPGLSTFTISMCAESVEVASQLMVSKVREIWLDNVLDAEGELEGIRTEQEAYDALDGVHVAAMFEGVHDDISPEMPDDVDFDMTDKPSS